MTDMDRQTARLIIEIRAVAMANLFWRHSDGYRWLRARYSHLQTVTPDWDAVAAQVAKEGFVGKRGQRLSGRALRRTWRQVCRDIESHAPRRRARSSRRSP
jgi:hypothetical protein